jgi:hypothetical protein
MENMELYNKLRVVPEEAKKPIEAGRLKGFTDINPMWRIKALTETFGPCGFGWWYKITDKRMEGKDGEIRAFVDIELYVKWNDEVSQPIPGTGGASFLTKERNGAYTSDECYKMALTDAISVAAKALGVAADVYYDKDRDKYTTVDVPADPPQQKTQQRPPEAPKQKPAEAPRQRVVPPPPDVIPFPGEAPDGQFICDACKQVITPWLNQDGSVRMTAEELARMSIAEFSGRQLCRRCGYKLAHGETV